MINYPALMDACPFFRRKVSAHEFERVGLLNPIVNTIDGTPTFLSVSGGTSNAPAAPTPATRPHRRSRHELRQLDEKELIFELVSANSIWCNPRFVLIFE